MPWVSPPLRDPRESPTLVVLTTVLQLGLVVAVWLVALIPAAVAAVTFMGVKALRRALGDAAPPPPFDDGR